MKLGEKLILRRNGDISQSYMPWGAICEFVKSFDQYICVSYEEREFLINKDLLIILEE